MSEANQETAKGPSPPYVAFSTTKTFLGSMKAHGAPGRIDRSVLGNFSGQVGSQLMTALRFLGLIDHNGTPTPALIALVDAYETESWAGALHAVLSNAYQPIMAVNLANATPAQFNDHFRAVYPSVEGDTVRKAMAFFLAAAKEAGVQISPYIMKNKKPRTAATRRKPPRPKETVSESRASGTGTADADKHRTADRDGYYTPPQTAEQALLAMLDPNRMSPEEQQAVFTLLLFLKKNPATVGGAQ